MENKEWISIEDKLPKVDEQVLVYYTWDNGKYTEYDCAYISEILTRETADGIFKTIEWRGKDLDAVVRPTHWMPLPEPPKQAT